MALGIRLAYARATADIATMPAKGMRGRPCAYCVDGLSTKQGDHVLARQLVLPPYRDGLPKAPACEQCNHRKSELEAYVCAVLPFGGKHEGAPEAMEAAAPRLAGNLKLARELQAGASLAVDHTGPFSVALTRAVPFEAEKLEALAAMMARGLLHAHWGLRLGSDFVQAARSVTHEGDILLQETLLSRGGDRLAETIGGGALRYEVVKSTAEPHVSIWRMAFYGGAVGVGEGGERSVAIYAFLGRDEVVQKLLAAIE